MIPSTVVRLLQAFSARDFPVRCHDCRLHLDDPASRGDLNMCDDCSSQFDIGGSFFCWDMQISTDDDDDDDICRYLWICCNGSSLPSDLKAIGLRTNSDGGFFECGRSHPWPTDS